jgi:hypothetical protein
MRRLRTSDGWWRGLGTVAVAVSMMLAALVLGCCDDTAAASADAGGHAVRLDRPAAPVAGANAEAVIRAVDDCVGGPQSVSSVPSPSGASVPLPSQATNSISSDYRAVSHVFTGVAGESGRYRLCVMRT